MRVSLPRRSNKEINHYYISVLGGLILSNFFVVPRVRYIFVPATRHFANLLKINSVKLILFVKHRTCLLAFGV